MIESILKEEKKNFVLERSVQFSDSIIVLYKQLVAKNEFILSKQLLRSATSVGANLMESKFAASKKDFLNKVVISLKEANETLYRLKLLKRGEFIYTDYDRYLAEINFIISILVRIVNTTRRNLAMRN